MWIFMCGATMVVRAADAWSIARFCALVAKEADDDTMCRSLINIRDVWIDIANESELLGTREDRAARVEVTSNTTGPAKQRSRIAGAVR